ncbi:MAG: universal stress protein, partial [Polyangiaceae bacterium]
MSPFKRILVPVDFEAASACAVDTAIELGKTLDANVTLLHVDELPPAAYASFAEAIVWPIEEVTRAARAKLDALLKESKAKYPRVDGTLIGGRAA